DLDALVSAAIKAGADARDAINRGSNELAAALPSALATVPRAFAAVCTMEASGRLTATQAKQVLAVVIESGGEPVAIADSLGFQPVDASSLEAAVDEVIASDPA